MRRVTLWRLVGGCVSALALVAAAACTSESTIHPAAAPATSGPTNSPQVSSLSLTPANNNARNVSPADTISAAMADGSLSTVTLKAANGSNVVGEFDATRSIWHNTVQLAYGTSYTFTADGTGKDGKQYHDTRSFSTVEPNNLTLPYLRANDGTLLDKGTFGVGQPIIVYFDEQITDRAAAERSLIVETDPPGIVGGWYWINSSTVHWRPRDYWPAGTKVVVLANVFGHNLGNGLYGQQNVSASFTIGRSKIAVADAVTKHMKVYIDGQQVTKINGHDVTGGIPVSMGKGGTETTPEGVTIDFTTNSGPHVIMQKFEHIIMRSDSFGIIDKNDPNYYVANIGKALQISGDGEFVHLADWNIPQQGHVNTSHGCINVGPDYIYWFYDTFGPGDVVDVTGTNRRLALTNGLGDWTLTWAQWQKGSALH
jgi:lipoprotein-anchoring transpeptidase ErfK/SrfK